MQDSNNNNSKDKNNTKAANKEETLTVGERILYALAVVLAPGIPVFYLYGNNAAQGIVFSHFVIFSAVLALVSLVLYLAISKLYLPSRRTVILLVVFWILFWFLPQIVRTILGGFIDNIYFAFVAISIVIFIAYILRNVNVNGLVANTVSVMLCVLFAFNFVPEAITVVIGSIRRSEQSASGALHNGSNAGFYIDDTLPKPNIYWIHMDGMIGFSAVEQYFGDCQSELKQELSQRGFLINEEARLDAGYTRVAIPSMLSPVFYDSYLSAILSEHSHLTRSDRENAVYKSMTDDDVSLNNALQNLELFEAVAMAGYDVVGTSGWPFLEIPISYRNSTMLFDTPSGSMITHDPAMPDYNRFSLFANLIIDASALTLFKYEINGLIDTKRPPTNYLPVPEYSSATDVYTTGVSSGMAWMVRAMEHTKTFDEPFIIYFINMSAHVEDLGSRGRAYIFDENGERRMLLEDEDEDINDVMRYLPQHKYAAKEMLAMVDTILKNDPDAVIILQGDHGIHGIGTGSMYYDTDFMLERGYSLEDQLNLNMHVISAVRIPPQYGSLDEPLDPLDISRYLVNTFIGAGNYDYLYYGG